jgi:hypothetical protein
MKKKKKREMGIYLKGKKNKEKLMLDSAKSESEESEE